MKIRILPIILSQYAIDFYWIEYINMKHASMGNGYGTRLYDIMLNGGGSLCLSWSKVTSAKLNNFKMKKTVLCVFFL